jgi:hypothetical protein
VLRSLPPTSCCTAPETPPAVVVRPVESSPGWLGVTTMAAAVTWHCLRSPRRSWGVLAAPTPRWIWPSSSGSPIPAASNLATRRRCLASPGDVLPPRGYRDHRHPPPAQMRKQSWPAGRSTRRRQWAAAERRRRGPAVRTICRQPSGELGVVDEFLPGSPSPNAALETVDSARCAR